MRHHDKAPRFVLLCDTPTDIVGVHEGAKSVRLVLRALRRQAIGPSMSGIVRPFGRIDCNGKPTRRQGRFPGSWGGGTPQRRGRRRPTATTDMTTPEQCRPTEEARSDQGCTKGPPSLIVVLRADPQVLAEEARSDQGCTNGPPSLIVILRADPNSSCPQVLFKSEITKVFPKFLRGPRNYRDTRRLAIALGSH